PAALVLEIDHLRVVVDPETGWLSSLVDKATGAELALGTPHGHAVVLEDPSDTWSHDVRSYEDEAGRFACSAVRRVEDGPVRSTLVVESTFGASRLTERLVLGRRARHLEVRVTLDWRERLRALKLRFPSALADATATFSIPYGQLERPADGSEEPAQSWVDVSGALPDGRRAGWSLLNDSKHGFDVSGSEIGMTSARSPVYAWHDPQPLDPALREEYHYLDQGIQEFTYALVPHDGDWRSAGTVRLAEQLNQVPLVVLEHFHPGELPPARAFCSSGDRSVVVSVVKVAEDGSGLVLRLVETSGERAAATIELALLGRSFEVELAPSEVKTFLVPLQPGELVREVSLLEWDDPSGPDAR
ncbi:MAG: alpha-mannosidase, partial [Acidimicrobiaceae bacterium]|nr:alpha-mannosidase [Acidimicrobiaceae bacterium]